MTAPAMREGTSAPQLRGALERLEGLAKEFNAPDLGHRAWLAREPLERGEIWIVVVGQFKRGKSTLLNALLGEPILPSGIVPVTSVVTHLRWAPEPVLRVAFQDGRDTTEPIHTLPDYVSEERNSANHRGVVRVEVGLPSTLLEGGLVLVDTPGIGSLDPGATERAYAFLPRVDAAILVLSPDPPLGEAEGVYLKALLDHTRHILFVLNKVDLYPEDAWQQAVEFNRRGLARIQGAPVGEVELLPLSASLGLYGGTGGIRELKGRLLELVRERGEEVSQEAAMRRLLAVAGELRARIQVEEQAIRLTDEKLTDRLARLAELRKELALRREDVRPILLDATRRLVESATESLRAHASKAQDDLAESILALPARHPAMGNMALVQAVSDDLSQGVKGVFDAWWDEHGEALRGRLRDAMVRAAGSVDATGSTLSRWVQEELGVALPTPPPPVDLIDSHDFYYHVQGMKPELTVDLLGLLLPKSLFRWRLRRKAHRLVGGDLDLNVGRIRGDLLYRAQETVRAFFAELDHRAVSAEDGIQAALVRASRVRAGEREEGIAELSRLAGGGGELDGILSLAGEGRVALDSSARRPRDEGPSAWEPEP